MEEFTTQAIDQIEHRVTHLELRTKAELRVAILDAADPYPGAGCRQAFLLTIFIATLVEIFYPLQAEHLLVLITALGLFFILLADFIPGRKYFITKLEKEREVKEKAMSLFFQHGLYQTENRIGILLFISLLEKKIELLVDQTILEKLGQTKLDQIVAEISRQFKMAHFSDGIQNGLNLIEEELLKHFPDGVQRAQKHELSNKVIRD